MRISIPFVWLLCAVPLVAAADGAELYKTYCLQCHGQNASMMSGGIGSPERFQEVLEGFTEDMPDFYGIFEPAQVEALYDYVTSLARQDQG